MKPHLRITVETLLRKGRSQREIERLTGVDRKTIRRYDREAKESSASNSPGVATGGSLEELIGQSCEECGFIGRTHKPTCSRRTTNKLTGRELEFGELIRPLFEHLPEVPVHEWHRFSFDVVQLRDSLQVAHIRFWPLAKGNTAPTRNVDTFLESHPGEAQTWGVAATGESLVHAMKLAAEQHPGCQFDFIIWVTPNPAPPVNGGTNGG